jgi:Family of unknown function (DUF5906)
MLSDKRLNAEVQASSLAVTDKSPDAIAGCVSSETKLEQICLELQPQTEAVVTDADSVCGVALEDFIALLPMHAYVFIPSREMWPAVSVNAKVAPVEVDGKKIKATDWLDANRCAVQLTWLPGAPLELHNLLIADGGWVERQGVTCLNTYRPPTIVQGNAAGADRWVDHCYKVYPDDADRLIRWCAHRVQHPQQKCNHALFLGGAPGVGKDTLLEPLKHAVGPWNFQEIAPKTLLGQFNGFAKAVVIRISEARDLGDTNRYVFYDASKIYCASPPDVLRVNEKHLREHYVPNCCGIIFTSNYRSDGLYLPADDRRHDVMWSDLTSADFTEGYWIGLWDWYSHGGLEAVAAYLQELDISGFDPAAPPPKTSAFWAMVDAGAAPEDAEVADVLDRLDNPAAVTLAQIKAAAVGDLFEWLVDRRNRRAIPHRLEKCGYVVTRNNDTKQGLWIIQETRQAIYTKAELTVREKYSAATELVRKSSSKH